MGYTLTYTNEYPDTTEVTPEPKLVYADTAEVGQVTEEDRGEKAFIFQAYFISLP